MTGTDQKTQGPDAIQRTLPPEGTHGHAPTLEGLSGRLRLDVVDRPVGTLEIRAGDVTFRRSDDGGADAVVIVDSAETLHAILDGALNPVVAALQNRLEIAGNRSFAIRVALGLLGSSPFKRGTVRH
jgi:putative sterol carrier protein